MILAATWPESAGVPICRKDIRIHFSEMVDSLCSGFQVKPMLGR